MQRFRLPWPLCALWVLSFLIARSSCSLIASSEVQACQRSSRDFEPLYSTGEVCSKKFIVALAVRNGQGDSNRVYANVRHVANNSGEFTRKEQLRKPFRIAVTKSDVHVNYPLRYLGSVNNNPQEWWVEVWNPILGITGCNDLHIAQNGGDTSRASCNYQHNNNGEVIVDSQATSTVKNGTDSCQKAWWPLASGSDNSPSGYCCGADADEKLSRKWKYRRGVGYQVWHYHVHKYSQAICMSYGPMWYHVFEIGDPFLTYQINVTVQQYDTRVRVEEGSEETREVWNTLGYATVGPERPGDNTANNKDGKTSTPMIKVRWEGDFASTSSVNRLGHKYLLVPDWNSLVQKADGHQQNLVNAAREQFAGGHNEWLMVDKHLVDFTGRTCNKLGVSFTGFRYQRNGCRQQRQSCFLVTPRSLFLQAKVDKDAGRKTPYFPTFYGDLLGPFHDQGMAEAREMDQNLTFRLVYRATNTQQSLVTLTFTADSVSFVENWSPGRIIETFIQDFDALGGAGQLYILVQNTGSVTSDYFISIEDCSDGIIRVSDRHRSIDPNQHGEYIFQLSTSLNENMNHTCHVELFDNRGSVLDTKAVRFSTFRTCYCAGQCECECNGETQISDSIFCTDDDKLNPFWTPEVVVRQECAHCWFTDSLRNPYSLSVFVVMCLLSLGMLKMLCLHTCCRAKDGRPIDLIGLLLGTASQEHTKRKSRNATFHFLLGACFFVYLPFLPVLMLLCNWWRKRKARQRLKRRAEKKKQRMIKKRKKDVKAMKGLMVTKGLQQEGVTYQEMMTLMDEGLEGKKAATKKQQKALVVSSSSSDTSEQDFDYTTSSGDDDLMPRRVVRRQGGGGGKGGGGGGGFMEQVGKEANKAMTKEAVKMGMGMLF